ncbi:unnamed protein product [Urochloa decumbens]|uniref:F-box domain-containing protein n=1 Tax=Urochloa decumbens TaxID=240449 RepID=A0ABC9FLL6_9POAL
MATVPRGKESRREGDDHISRLPDAILGEIISRLPTKDGGRTQAVASRWRHLWRSVPLSIDLDEDPGAWRLIQSGEISGILSSHHGPGRRFSVPRRYFDGDAHPAATLDGWLRSPALDGLRELEFHYDLWCRSPTQPPPPPPTSVCRFSSTLHVVSFGGCGFPDGNAGALHLPLLEQLSLLNVKISESSLYALLAGCPVLQSLMLTDSIGCSAIRIVSRTIRSIGVRQSSGSFKIQRLVIQDAPCLERLILCGQHFYSEMIISVISAPKLYALGQLPVEGRPRLEFGATVFLGSRVVNSTMVVPNVKVLALTYMDLSLDMVIEFMKCFPCLENLYIKMTKYYIESAETNACWNWDWNFISALDIRIKKIVLTTYQGNMAHVNFAKFFVLYARVLQSMVLEVDVRNDNKAWIERQQKMLHIENRASRGARFDFVHHFAQPLSLEYLWSEQVHDLSTGDPFVRFDRWA